ncbi:hypothetical protein ACN2WE_04865 [Streptomyces sp. cg28]|uniref:hypothetical protein n=1 Tax=Streptomyces sp. cg28 TaxID=3403457 RepID=UPI003B214363
MADIDSLIPLEQAAHAAHQDLINLQERFASQGEEGVRVPPGEWSEEQHAECDQLLRVWRERAEAFHAALRESDDRLGAEKAVKKAVHHPEPAAEAA